MSGTKFVKQKYCNYSSEYDMTFSWTPTINEFDSITLGGVQPDNYTLDFTVTKEFIDSQVTGKLHTNFATLYLLLFGTIAGSTNLYYRLYKNDVLLADTVSIPNGNSSMMYYTFLPSFFGVKEGDRISVKIWGSTSSSATYTMNLCALLPLHIKTSKYLFKDMSWTVSSSYTPALSSSKCTFNYNLLQLQGRFGYSLTDSYEPSSTCTPYGSFIPSANDNTYTRVSPYSTMEDWQFYWYNNHRSYGINYYVEYYFQSTAIAQFVRATHVPLRIRFREIYEVKR